jgi:IS1 family transposase
MAQKKWLTLPALETTVEEFQEGDELELDEIWSFVKRRKNKRWVWLALCRRTRQVVGFAIGNRGKRTCLLLWKAIPAAYKKADCFADIWEAYAKVIAHDQLTQTGSKANTNHVEGFNCILRQSLGRLVRETFSFSKTDEMHRIVLTLFLHDYNRSKLAT